jgi:hypothetical protein
VRSPEHQIEALAARWPEFRLVEHNERALVWEGLLAPVRQAYRLRIGYRPPLVIERFSLANIQPRVQVLDPMLERHADYDQGPIPHVYANRQDRRLPYLCLFDPDGREWSPDDLLADTTICWASRWLYFYEGWLLTRKWFGGGRHPVGDLGRAAAASI